MLETPREHLRTTHIHLRTFVWQTWDIQVLDYYRDYMQEGKRPAGFPPQPRHDPPADHCLLLM